jgi:hypothetical protein
MEPSLINDFNNTILEDLAIADNNQWYSQDYSVHCKSTFVDDAMQRIIVTFCPELVNNVNDKGELLKKRTGVELGMIYNGQMSGLIPSFYIQQVNWLRGVLNYLTKEVDLKRISKPNRLEVHHTNYSYLQLVNSQMKL